MSSFSPEPDDREPAIWRAAAQLSAEPVRALEPVGDGRNSRVYRVTTANGQVYALKAYFRHPSDHRDRLGTEFESLRFLWASGLRNIPRPLAADQAQGCALYEFIEGSKVDAVADGEIEAAVAF
jgi:predicted Ser/Thr protein kinase